MRGGGARGAHGKILGGTIKKRPGYFDKISVTDLNTRLLLYHKDFTVGSILQRVIRVP
jgi:hypothetical protein